MSEYYTRLLAQRLTLEAERCDAEAKAGGAPPYRTADDSQYNADYHRAIVDKLTTGEIDEDQARLRYIGSYYGYRIGTITGPIATHFANSLVNALRDSGVGISRDVADALDQQISFLFSRMMIATVALFGENRIIVDDTGNRNGP